MAKARKYILNLNSVISCGLGTLTGNTVQCSLLNPFTITYDTIPSTSQTYSQLTTTELQTISNIDYDSRVIDFLDFINIESGIKKQDLYSGSTFIDPNCSIYKCFLNENFLVYKFLTGVRIIDTGMANGIIQYLVSGGSYNSGWQNNATFLNLDQNTIYTVAIRDYIASENIVVCEYSKLISMQLLLPSTTVTLTPKLIGLSQITDGYVNNSCYKTGCFNISPSVLSQGQKVTINYTANASIYGIGSSCVVLTCKPNNQGTFVEYDRLTNADTSPKTNSITMCYGDVVCYNITATANMNGTNSNANICFTSVDGLCTIIPNIDVTNCSASVTSNIPVANVTVGLNRCTATNPNSNTCKITGEFSFNSPVPNGQCIDITLSAITTAAGSFSDSNICFTCKTIANPSVDVCIGGACNVQPQPQFPVITARCGDILCYVITLNAPNNGTSSCADLCIHTMTQSFGVNSIKSNTANCDSGLINKPAYPVVVSVCRTSLVGSQAKGYINIDPPLNGVNQVVNVTINATQSVHGAGDAIVLFKCQPFGSNTFVNIVPTLITTNPNNITVVNGTPSTVLSIKYGDVVCYDNYSSGDYGTYSGFVAGSATSSSDVIPSVSPTKYSDNVTPVPTVAKVNTNVVQSIAQTTAVGSGCVVCDGGSLVTERGFVWNTSTNPTVANNKVVNASAGLGSYTNNITGLVASTTYYLRAYAISSVATVYGVNQSFKTLAVPITGKVTVSNVDNRHKSIQINGLGGSGTYTSIIYSNPTVIVPIGTYSDAISWSASNAGSINNTPLTSVIGYTGSVPGSVCIRIRVTDSTFNNSYGTLQLFWNGSSVGVGTETWSAVQPW
jgi:hypothetical protein